MTDDLRPDLLGTFDDAECHIRYELTYDTGSSIAGMALHMSEPLPERSVEFTYAEIAAALAGSAWVRVQ